MATPRNSGESGAQLVNYLPGQVVLFLLDLFDRMMLAVAFEMHGMQMVVSCLFDLRPGRLAQRVHEVEPSCSPPALLGLDLLLRHAVHLGHRQQRGQLFVLGQRVCLALADRPVPLGVLPGRGAIDDAGLGAVQQPLRGRTAAARCRSAW